MQKSRLATEGIHADLETLFGLSGWRQLPTCAELNRLWRGAPAATGDAALTFVPQDRSLPFPELNYAQRIVQTGMIATRSNNWHDLFNALSWILFPRAKLVITKRLASGAGSPDSKTRSTEHNALTLFDECAVVLVATTPEFAELHAAHEWRCLFADHRQDFGSRIVPHVFGHGFYDQARNAYLGLTAKAWYEVVPEPWLSAPLAERYALLDARLEASVPRALTTPRQLLPFPALGVPGWWEENLDAAFYDNRQYFRPKRSVTARERPRS